MAQAPNAPSDPNSNTEQGNSQSNASTPAVDTWGTGNHKESDQPHEQPAAPVESNAKPDPQSAAGASEFPELRPAPSPEADASAPAHLRYTLEHIEVRGNSRTQARVILRYLKFKPGDIIDVDDPELTLTRYRLLGTGFFRDVQFALRKGSRRGQVVLVVEVVERSTIVFNDVGMGLSAVADNNGHKHPLTAYGGLDVAETNVGGTGWTIGAAIAVAEEQTALRIRYFNPAFLGSQWMVAGSLLGNKARDFFGTTSDVSWVAYDGTVHDHASFAVLDYTRFGGTLGFGRDLSTSTQLWAYYRLETIEAKRPLEAYEERVPGQGNVPITFDIRNGRSVLSTLRATFQLDTRDHPFLPTRGWYVSTWGELALPVFGSDYDYQRFDISASRWWQIRGVPHVLRLQMYAGAETGYVVPFFEQYYVGDFTDFRAPRMQGLNFERRPPPNVFRTIIGEQRYGQYAAKLGLEYRIPAYRGSRSVYGIDLFMSAGLWGLISRHDLMNMPSDYTGLARIPIDLTANIGFRMDTSAGGLTFSFSNILSFIPIRGGGT